MSNTKLIQYTHRPNITELGMGNTHETYMLISTDTDLANVFPPSEKVEVKEVSSDKSYFLKSAAGREFRVNQMGELYRDYNVLPGDEIVITKIEKDNLSYIYVNVRKYNRVVLMVGSNGTEIVNIDRIAPYKVNVNNIEKYVISISDRGNHHNLSIEFLESRKKRQDSPNTTDYYDVSINGGRLANGTYYLSLESPSSVLAMLPKSEYNEVIYDEVLANKFNTNKQSNLSIYKSHPLQQIFYGAPGTGKSKTIKDETNGKSVVRTTFHPDSDYSTFVGAYKPTMDDVDTKVVPVVVKSGISLENEGTYKEKKIVYKFIPQAFLKAYLGAWKNQDNPFFLVIEEINRGNCAQIFGDLFQLLDRGDNGFSEYPIEADTDLQKVIESAFKEGEYKLTNDINIEGEIEGYTSNYGATLSEDVQSGRVLLLPKNLYIWATMNTSDQSLFPIDSAFKRRWDWKYIKIKNHPEENYKIVVGDEERDWYEFIEKINDIIASMTSSADKQLGYFFCKADKNGKISAKTFVSKVIFYLWNDVFKDYGFEDTSLFRYVDEEDGKEKDLTFPAFYGEDSEEVNETRLKDFLDKVMNWKKDKEEQK